MWIRLYIYDGASSTTIRATAFLVNVFIITIRMHGAFYSKKMACVSENMQNWFSRFDLLLLIRQKGQN